MPTFWNYGAEARTKGDEARSLFADLEREATGRLRSWFAGPMTTGAAPK